MAESVSVPVCDVLCEAMEYLSKLGSNLRVRSENLKEKKIRKDRLKNTHAVQKAAKKVLLICELSKKSLDNVETGVKNLLTQIDLSQASACSGGKSSRPSNKSVSYEYFEYNSKRLRIREKICLKHYTSVKVIANPMPLSMIKKYPIYLDCKLYRIQKENEKLEQALEKDHNVVNENNFDSSFCETQRDINSQEDIMNDDNYEKLNESPQTLTTDCVPLSIAEIEDSTKNDNVLTKENNENAKNIVSRKKSECENKVEDEYPETSKEEEPKEFSETNTQSSSNDRESNKDSNNEINLGLSIDNLCSGDVDNDDALSESSDNKKSFIKCVNINKLLKSPNKEDDNFTINKDSITTTTKEQQKTAPISKKVKRKKYKRISRHKSTSDDSSLENDFEEKQKAVKLFIAKEFVIKIQRLPKFSVNFLKAEGLNKITHSGLTLCDIKSCLDNPKELQITQEKGLEDLPCASQRTGDKNVEQKDKLIEKTSEKDISKENLMNDSDSDKSLNRKTDKYLFDVAESVRNALLHGSDSDRQSEFENIGSSTEPAPNEKESLDDKVNNAGVETNKCNESNENENLEENRETSLLNSSSDNNGATLQNEITNSELEENSQCNKDAKDASQDPEKVKSSLLNDDSDNSISNPNIEEKINEDEHKSNNDDPEKVKSSLLNDSSDNFESSPNKKEKINEDKDKSNNEDPEKVKSSLLDDSSDNSVSNPNKNDKDNEDKDKSNNEDLEKVKSQLLKDLSDNIQEKPLEQNQETEKDIPRKNKRKHIMESMYAKKMLLTYSSSSDTEDEQLKDVLKEIKESLLEEIISDKGKQCIKIRPHNNSDSDSEKIVAEVVKRTTKRKATSPPGNKGLKLTLRIKKRNKSKTNNSDSEDNEHSNSGSSKMGRTRAKRGSSSQNTNSDSQDANDKDIEG